eukprot:scaffold19823_cov74-Cyclotella_meneghiniana.AAC.5
MQNYLPFFVHGADKQFWRLITKNQEKVRSGSLGLALQHPEDPHVKKVSYIPMAYRLQQY